MLLQTRFIALVYISQVLWVKASLGGLLDSLLGDVVDPLLDALLNPLIGKPKDSHAGTVWDSLVVTWGPPGVPNPWTYTHLPITVGDAKKQHWTKLDNGCTDKSLGFLGERYIFNNDTGAFLIFDPNGYVAGIQMAVPKSNFDANGVNDPAKFPAATPSQILGKDFYVITAYFVPIDTICKRGRTAYEFKKQGTLTKLWFITGKDSLTNPDYVPLKLGKELEEKSWTKGKCAPEMGMHYFPNFPLDLNCATAHPWGLLFDNAKDNQLVGFDFFLFGEYPSNRFEHATKNDFPVFFDPVPTCFNGAFDTSKGFTPFHVYFVSDPQGIQCPK